MVAPGERRRLALSFAYFALLLASYYLIRPVRDALAAGLGAGSVKYLATAVFFVMLAIVPVFGALVARVRRSRLLPWTYAFFALNLIGFAIAFRLDPDGAWAGRAFYVWTTVFNLFVVSVFWSFMAEIWHEEEGRRLFGVIAAGGSLGGIAGPTLARLAVGTLGTSGLTLLAAGLLGATVVVILALARERRPEVDAGAPAAGGSLDEPVGGAILAGLSRLLRSPFLAGIAALVALGSLLGMFVYIELAREAGSAFASAAERTAFFSTRDQWINGASLVLQFLVVGSLSRRFGVRPVLAGSASLALAAFMTLALAPTLGVLLGVNVLLRSVEFGLAKPNRDMLYTVVDPETKYKVKNVVDTVVYRGSDMVSSWVHAALAGAGLTLTGVATVGAGIGALLVATAWAVGTGYRRRGGL
ncbi:MAG: MFS transporter [Proteobacteria bacterium]|nr:MFS transporter [Pseudomonadota bacterium]